MFKENKIIASARRQAEKITKVIDRSREKRGREVSDSRHNIEYEAADEVLDIARDKQIKEVIAGSNVSEISELMPGTLKMYKEKLDEKRRERLDQLTSRIATLNATIKMLEDKRRIAILNMPEEVIKIDKEISDARSESQSLNEKVNELASLT